MRGPGEKSGLSRAERSSGGAGGCQRSRRVNLSEPGTCAGVTEQACEQADRGWKPVRAPTRADSRSRRRSCTDPRPGLRTRWRGAAPAQSRTSDAGREDRGPGVRDETQAALPAPTFGLRGEKEETECAPRWGLREGTAHSRPPGQSARVCGWWLSLPMAPVSLKMDSVTARGACASPLTLHLGSAEDPPRS